MEAELARAKHEQRGQDVVYQPTTIEAFEADVLSNPDAESVN